MSPITATAPAAFPPTTPYVLAVVGRHPDTQQFLRDVQWIAREKGMSFALAIHQRGDFRRWLVGEDIAAGKIGERWDVPRIYWQQWTQLSAIFHQTGPGTSDGRHLRSCPPVALAAGGSGGGPNAHRARRRRGRRVDPGRISG